MSQGKRYTWHYLNGFLAGSAGLKANDTYRREAEGRYRLYELAPIMLPEAGLIVGNLDKALINEVIVNKFNRHFIQRDVLDAILSSDRKSVV